MDITRNVGTEEITIDISGGEHVRVKNLGESTVYVSNYPNIIIDKENVIEVPNGCIDGIPNVCKYQIIDGTADYYGTIYAKSDGETKIEIRTQNNANFRYVMKGGDDNTDCKIIIEYVNELPENVKQSTIYLVNTENGYLEYVGSKPLGYLQIPEIPEILRQPSDCYTRSGTTAEFSVEAIGKDLKYQWQYSLNQGRWFNSTVATGTEKTVLISARTDTAKNDYRCVVTDSSGNQAISNVVNIILTNVSESIENAEYLQELQDKEDFNTWLL